MMVRSFRAGALAPLRNATTPTASRRPPLHRGEFNPLNMEESLCRETILLQGIPDQVRDDGCFLFVGGLFYFRDAQLVPLSESRTSLTPTNYHIHIQIPQPLLVNNKPALIRVIRVNTAKSAPRSV